MTGLTQQALIYNIFVTIKEILYRKKKHIQKYIKFIFQFRWGKRTISAATSHTHGIYYIMLY